MELLVSIHREGMGVSSLLVMITLGLNVYIGDLMPQIHSSNLRRDWITYWVHIPSHFDQIKVICLVSLILTIGAQDYFLVMCTRVSIVKWIGGKKISNLVRHSEIVDRFLMFSQILLRICLIESVIPFFSYEVYQFIGYLRGILGYYLYSQDHQKIFVDTNIKLLMKTI